jgi:hypothetical protein
VLEVRQVEDHVHHLHRLLVLLLEELEARPALLVEGDDLAVHQGVAGNCLG